MSATKGASNKFGNKRDGKQGQASNFIGFEYATDFNKHTLERHFVDHGKQMNANSPQSYAAKAVNFANRIDRENMVSFVDKGDSTYKYDKSSNTLVIVTKDGYVVTFFKPDIGYKYYLAERRKNKDKKGGRKNGKKQI